MHSWIRLSGVALLWLLASHASTGAQAAVPDSATTLWDELGRFSGDKAAMVDAYVQLQSRPWDGAASGNLQLLSMSSAMVGRYAQARQEMDRAFGRVPPPVGECAEDLAESSFESWLADHAGTVDLVIVNEAHNQPLSRTLVYQMLPVMRQLGFSVLALEALPDEATTAWINHHGYVPEEEAYGFYLREPIEAEIVREAKRLGFTLVNYDDITSKERELAQARNLARIVAENPRGKVFVVAGYDHGRRVDGRMAQRLPELYEQPFLSIDQLGAGNNVMRNICTPRDALVEPVAAGSLASMRWKSGGRGTDVTVVRAGDYALDRAPSTDNAWLTLGGLRWHYRFDSKPACASTPCLAEARYAAEPADAAPADRYLVWGQERFADLYLRDGQYVVSYRNAAGEVVLSTEMTAKQGHLTVVE